MQPQLVWQAQFSQRLWVVWIAFFMVFLLFAARRLARCHRG